MSVEQAAQYVHCCSQFLDDFLEIWGTLYAAKWVIVEQFSIKNKCSLCYGAIILLIKVSALPNPSSILSVLAKTIGERQSVCVSKEVFLPQTFNPTKGKNLGKCSLRNIFPMEPKDSGIADWNLSAW